jgi:hypothetical protein
MKHVLLIGICLEKHWNSRPFKFQVELGLFYENTGQGNFNGREIEAELGHIPNNPRIFQQALCSRQITMQLSHVYNQYTKPHVFK